MQEVPSTRQWSGKLPTLSQNLLRKYSPLSFSKSYLISNGDSRQATNKKCDNTLVEQQIGSLLHSSEMQDLESIISMIMDSKFTVRKQYRQDMMHSLNKLKIVKSLFRKEKEQIDLTKLSAEIAKARQTVH